MAKKRNVSRSLKFKVVTCRVQNIFPFAYKIPGGKDLFRKIIYLKPVKLINVIHFGFSISVAKDI